MHLNPKSKLYGQPAIMVRDFLREVIGMGIFDTEDLFGWLQCSSAEAHAVVAGLLADAYIEPTTPMGSVSRYCLTVKGTQLGLASFAPRLKRAAAEQLLAAVIARAADTEAQRPFVFQVTKIALFGSMLGDAAFVPELDFAMKVRSAFTDETLAAAEQRRIDLAAHGGKRFQSMVHLIAWPRYEVAEYLKGRARYVKFHSFSELDELGCPFKIVYERPEGDATT